MGAFGAALVAKQAVPVESGMRALDTIPIRASGLRAETFVCSHCANACEVVRLVEAGQVVAHLGERCDRWTVEATTSANPAPLPGRR
jgi:hypothetical protein